MPWFGILVLVSPRAPPRNLNKDTEMTALFNRFVREESGQDLIEYGLLIGIITATVVTTVTAISTKVQTYYTSLKTALEAT